METRTILSTIQTGMLEEDIVAVEPDDDAIDEKDAARDADAAVRAIEDATHEKKPSPARGSRRFGFDALERRAE